MKPDTIDLHILQHLQNDGRMTNVELASRVGISAPPCLRRVRVLEEEGIIRGYHADVDPEALEFGVTAFVFLVLRRRTDTDLKLFEQKINGLPMVRECNLLVGEVDFLLKVIAKTSEDFKQFLNETLSKMENIHEMKWALSVRRSKWFSGVPIEEIAQDNQNKRKT